MGEDVLFVPTQQIKLDAGGQEAETGFGKLEPLPQDLGVWKEDTDSPAAIAAQKEGLKREQRFFFEESRQRLLKQGRYRSLGTNEVVKVDRDEVVKRRRLKS